MSVDCFRETRQGGLVRPASKSGRFSHHPLRVPKAWHRNFAACGQQSGLLAHTSPTFLKNCWIKKLLVACGSYLTINSFLQISCQMHQNCKCCLRCSFTPQNPLSQPHRIKSSCLCCFCLLRVKSAFAANPQGNLLFSSQRYF